MAPLTLAFTLLIATFAHADSHPHWSYSGEGSPEKWGKLSHDFAVCEEGFNQSPVDIKNITKGELPPLSLTFNAKDKSIINNGHTLQVDVRDGDTLTLDGSKFTLKQFHFHAPSENRIDGRVYPLEVHFVHSNAKGELAVVGVMFEQGKENPTIEQILKNLPSKKNEARPLDTPLALSDLMPGDKNYYRFSGSLTTPPCTEGVRWLVMKQPISASPKQISAFELALGLKNNRPIQPLNGRLIVN